MINVVELKNYTHLKNEGNAIGNCIGSEIYYYTRIKDGSDRAFSMRTKSGRSKFTIFVEFFNEKPHAQGIEVRGKHNRLPGLLRDEYDDDEVSKFKPKEVIELIMFFKEYFNMTIDKILKIEDMKPGVSILLNKLDENALTYSKETIKRIRNPSGDDILKIYEEFMCDCHCSFCCDCE